MFDINNSMYVSFISFLLLLLLVLFISFISLMRFRPRSHQSVFKRKRNCIVLDTAIVHTTTLKTITENGAIRKRSPKLSDLKTMPFENAVCTEKTILSENGDVIKIDAGRYIEMRMLEVHLNMRTEGIKRFQNRYGVVVWTGENDLKTISVDANLFKNGAKQLRFRLKMD